MLTVRRAAPGDVPALVPLLVQLFTQETEFTPAPELQARGLAAIIGDPRVGVVVLGEDEGRAVGMANLLYTTSTALGTRVAILEDMVVDKDWRGRGVGSKVLAFAIETVRADGCARITLLSDRENASAHRFYRRFGFTSSAMTPFRLALPPTLMA
jgi:GNAT superfamily N-acetyltransferase